jgi:CheY-like chemotaxis protein
MPDGGVLTIATGESVFDEAYLARHPGARAGRYTWMSVSDTGTGISQELQAKIFEPFFTTKDHGQGTGLGLAAVYGTIKQLDGYIDLASEPGRGSTFMIHIPVTAQKVSNEPRVTPTAASVGNETILLVEDEAGVRAFVSKALRRFGYHVIEADSAENALQAVTSGTGRFDLLLTDIVLPGLDGVELASMLRQRNPALPILCMTGYSEKLIHVNMSGDERLPLLEKPFSPKALLAKVRELLG